MMMPTANVYQIHASTANFMICAVEAVQPPRFSCCPSLLACQSGLWMLCYLGAHVVEDTAFYARIRQFQVRMFGSPPYKNSGREVEKCRIGARKGKGVKKKQDERDDGGSDITRPAVPTATGSIICRAYLNLSMAASIISPRGELSWVLCCAARCYVEFYRTNGRGWEACMIPWPRDLGFHQVAFTARHQASRRLACTLWAGLWRCTDQLGQNG